MPGNNWNIEISNVTIIVNIESKLLPHYRQYTLPYSKFLFVYNIYLHRLANNFIIKAFLKIFIYFLRVPKNSKIRHLRKKINILRRRHFIKKLRFLVACISPGSGGLSTIRLLQSISPNMSLNISEIWFNVILSNYNVKGL